MSEDPSKKASYRQDLENLISQAKAPYHHDLEDLIAQAKARVARMTPEELKIMEDKQRKSFVRAMTTPCEHGVLDFEQCPKCRGWDK